MAIQAGDASYSRPSATDMKSAGLVAIGVYTGNARPDAGYVKGLLDGGVAVWWIQETFSGRSLQGFQAGVYDAQYADQRVNEIADAIGISRNTGKIWYCFSDGDAATPSGDAARASMQDYARGIESASSRAEFGAYGNRWAVDSARIGSSHCTGTWVPQSWDANNTDTLWQMANIANPLDGVDMDWVVRDISEIGAWGTTPAPPPPHKDDEDVPVYIQKKSDPSAGIWVTDGVFKRHVLPDEWAFVMYVGGKDALPLTDAWWDSLPVAAVDTSLYIKDLVNIQATVKAIPTGTTGTTTGTGLTADQVHAIVRAELDKTKLGS